MATTIEALIGAVFCDGGEEALEKVLETLQLDHEYLKSVMLTILSILLETGAEHTVLANYVARP